MKRVMSIAAFAGLALAGLTSSAFASVVVRVPEPSTITILAAGAAGVLVLRRFRRK